MEFKCLICGKVFSTQSNLNRHLFDTHKKEEKNIVQYDYEYSNNKCLEGCECSFKYTYELRYHLIQEHGMVMDEKKLEFKTFEEFKAWISRICKTNNVHFCQRKTKDYLYYNCNRSGAYLEKTNRKRVLKRQGLLKVGHMCTCQVVLKKQNDNYCATYYSNHYGHDLDVQCTRIPKEERASIASKLSDGITTEEIIDSYRGDAEENNISRTNRITRKDINNIKASFKIDVQEESHQKIKYELKKMEKGIHFIKSEDVKTHILKKLKGLNNIINLTKGKEEMSVLLESEDNSSSQEPENEKIKHLTFYLNNKIFTETEKEDFLSEEMNAMSEDQILIISDDSKIDHEYIYKLN